MSLSELYKKDKAPFLKDLHNALTPQAVMEVIHAYLSKITDLQGEYVSGLTLPQARVVLLILGTHQEHFRKISIAFEQVANVASPNIATRHSNSGYSHSSSFPTAAAIGGVGAASIIAGFLMNPIIGVPVATVVGLGVVKLLLPSDKASMPVSNRESNIVAEEYPTDQLPYYSAFLENLEDLFKTVDTVVEELSRLEEAARPRPVIPKLEDHPRFLEFIQDLLGWYQRKKGDLPETALQALQMRLEEQLPDLFSQYNIQIQYGTLERGERDLTLFDYEEEVGDKKLSAPILARPALSKQGDVLLRGRVIEPRSSGSDISP